MLKKNKFNDLKLRFYSSIILILIVFFCIWYGSFLIFFMILFFSYVSMKEWINLPLQCNFYCNKTYNTWLIYGLLYITIPSIAILLIRYSNNSFNNNTINYSFIATIWLLSIAISTDIGAYFIGRLIGGIKVSNFISPNKTWSGVIGGIIIAILFNIFILNILNISINWKILKLTAILSIISQCGDFFESYIKRKFLIKDSGTFLPGHGGLLDRIDGHIFVIIAASIYAISYGSIDKMAFNLIGEI